MGLDTPTVVKESCSLLTIKNEHQENALVFIKFVSIFGIKMSKLIGLNFEQLCARLSPLDLKHSFSPRQIWDFMYDRGVDQMDSMSSLSKTDRARLNQHFTLGYPSVGSLQTSSDGTLKWLLNYGPKSLVETVFIPETEGSGTVCVSSQVGCSLACAFCHTGTQKLQKNLSASEILTQIMHVMKHVSDLPRRPGIPRKIGNIVFMVTFLFLFSRDKENLS